MVIKAKPTQPVLVFHDNDADMLSLLRRLLRGMATGYETINAVGAEVLDQIALRDVRLVITDYKPSKDGLQLIAAIKTASPETCVVLMTAYSTPELEVRAIGAGVDHYLPKPFSLDRLERIAPAVLIPPSTQPVVSKHRAHSAPPHRPPSEVILLSEEEIVQQQTYLIAHRGTLANYIHRLALVSTAHAPPEVTHGISEARANIARIKATLHANGVVVEDHPDDAAPPT